MAETPDSELEVSSSLGKLKASGSLVVFIIITSVATSVLWNQIHEHETKSNEHLSKILEAQEATNYILTLSQDDKNKLQLNKPKAIREMERRDR